MAEPVAFSAHGEVNITEESLEIDAQACLTCGALVKITFTPEAGHPVGIDNLAKHREYHRKRGE